VAVDVKLATPADGEALVDLFHAMDVHYWGAAALSRAAGRGKGLLPPRR